MALTISIISLLVSLLTFWLTRMYSGNVKMTRPTIVSLLGQNGTDSPKIFIRTLLYSTADKGRYVQDMYIKLSGNQQIQYFNIWAYGDKEIVRGSGLFINKTGFSSYHHFLLQNEQKGLNFSAGEYDIEIFVEVVNKSPKRLFITKLLLSEQQAEDLMNHKPVYFDWDSKTQSYIGHPDIKQVLQSRLK